HELFLEGDYLPLRVTGQRSKNVVAFGRRWNEEWSVTIVPRLPANLTRPGNWPVGGKVWSDTAVEVDVAAPAQWMNVLTEERVREPLKLSEVFGAAPFAVLSGCQ